MKILVLDIETVRDEAVWTPPAPPEPWALAADAKPIQGDSNDVLEIEGEVRPPTPDHFAPPFAWQPIVIGCVLLERVHDQGPRLNVVKVGAIEGGSPEVDIASRERTILKRFSDFVGDEPPLIVTWNGRAFDLPVLMLRSMRLGIAQPWYYRDRDNRYRFSEDGHCDLADAMGDYGAVKHHLGLDGMAKLIGLPGKFGDIDGAGVAEAFEAGRHAEIARYCMADAVQTAFLWARWCWFKGLLPVEAYREAAASLLAGSAEHLPELAGLVDRKVLLLEGEGG